MKKISSILFLSLFFHLAIAQTAPTQYWIQLKDKNASPFSVNAPSAYLSAKAIARRNKQNIAITNSDLPVNPNYINEIKSLGVAVLNQSRWFNAITISSVDTNKINAIKELIFVKSIKKIDNTQQSGVPSKFKMESNTMAVSSEKSGSRQSTDVLDYGVSYYQANQIQVNCLHNQGYQGQGMIIAVLDAGFYNVNILPAFDSLRVNHQILGTYDFVSGDTMVYEDYPHGMNVLSCMGGNIPGQLVGTAPKAKYWLLRTEDAATEKIIEEMNWLRGAEFADSVGADIINSSLGYNYFDNTADSHTYADMDGHTTIISKAAELAADKGILVVSAAGNAAGYPWYKITAPADADSILTVGAVDSAGFIAGFSSRGLTYDGRIKPDVVARGVQAITAADAGGINAENGTSFASPITAGAVACLWQANPTATNMQLINAIRQSANQFSTPDSIKGYGIPNFCAAHTILTGIDNPNVNTDELMVYPNPFKDNITIVFYSNKKQVIIVSLYDVTGKEIFKQEKNVDANANNTISIAGNKALSNGTYILHLTTPDKSYYKKLNKN